MKKRFGWFLAIIVALIMTVVPLGQTQHAQAADNSLEQIQKKGVLVMGTSPDYPPYEFQATVNGKSKIVGMDVQIGKQVAKDLGVKLKIKSMSFDSLLVALQTGKVDMLSLIHI